MKKEKSPVLVILCIFLLSLFVVLPPTFRKLIPKNLVDTVSQNQQSKLVIVSCNRIYQDELYQVNSKTKYVDGTPSSNTITYQKLDILPDNFVPSEIVDQTTVAAYLTYFKSIPNLQIKENENNIIVNIDNDIISNTLTDEKIKQYLTNNYLLQKKMYESLGYKCNVLES